MGKQLIRKNDLLLLSGVLLCSAMIAGVRLLMMQAPDGQMVVVTQDQTEIGRYALDRNATFVVESPDGGKNTVVIENGACFVREADCPDEICVRRGRIRRDGETIVCLPHRLVIRIEGGEESGVDAVAQ
ncbi:MAG: NusG domain II-containing protein [Lachnospiraceae bacterium]|nr:NusG domain II-containing protein [Lachnospiraceae bacterium]